MRRRLVPRLPVFAIWGFAYVRLFVDPTRRGAVLFNWTPSLPYHVALMQFQPRPVQRGDLIVFAFDGEAQARLPGLRGQPSSDRARRAGRCGHGLDGRSSSTAKMGRAKTHAFDGHPLDPSPTGHPAGPLLRAGHGPDLRLALCRSSGLVRAEAGGGHRPSDLLRRTPWPCPVPASRRADAAPAAAGHSGGWPDPGGAQPGLHPGSAHGRGLPKMTCRWPTTSACCGRSPRPPSRARTWLAAAQTARCGRPADHDRAAAGPVRQRTAIPALMGLIRAAHQQNTRGAGAPGHRTDPVPAGSTR